MDPRQIKQHIQDHYAALFFEGHTTPPKLAIPSGKPLAKELGYASDLLELIPDHIWDLFAPCGNPMPYLQCSPTERILNLGCGVGIDSFIIAAHPLGLQVTGLDVVWEALDKARRWSHAATCIRSRPSWVCADGEDLPFRAQCFAAIVMNGVFNLFPDKRGLLSELRRVLKPHGQLIIADLSSTRPLPEYFADEPDAWAWCMSGALTQIQMKEMLEQEEYQSVKVHREETGDLFERVVVTCRSAADTHL